MGAGARDDVTALRFITGMALPLGSFHGQIGGEPERRLLTLRGPAWLWDQATDMNNDTLLSNDLRVGIFPSAVAVHSRTMRHTVHIW